MNYDLNKLFSYIKLKLQSETFVKNTLQRSTLLKHEIESKMSNLYHRSLDFSTETINIEEYKEFLVNFTHEEIQGIDLYSKSGRYITEEQKYTEIKDCVSNSNKIDIIDFAIQLYDILSLHRDFIYKSLYNSSTLILSKSIIPTKLNIFNTNTSEDIVFPNEEEIINTTN